MKLPASLTTVTPLSKFIAMVLFVSLPFIGFYLGMEYQKKFGFEEIVNPIQYPNPSPTPTPTINPAVTDFP